MILSQHVEVGIAMRVLVESPERLGYLLKDRVTDLEDFAATLRHVAAGGSALDPQIVSRLLAGDRDDGPLAALTPREREVLELIAEGRSNKGIGERLEVSTGVVQKHVSSLFAKLGIPDSDDDHRRILVVLTFLRRPGGAAPPRDAPGAVTLAVAAVAAVAVPETHSSSSASSRRAPSRPASRGRRRSTSPRCRARPASRPCSPTS